MRYTGIALVAILLAGLGWVWLSGGTGRSAPADPAPIAPRTQEPKTEVATATSAPREPVPEAVTTEQPEAASAAAGTVHGSGTIVAVDAQGKEHREEDGELEIYVWKDNRGTLEGVIPVQKGRFAFDVAAGTSFSVSKSTLGGRPASLPREPIPVTESIELRATWSASIVLRVIDAETRADLSGVTVIARSSYWLEGCVHPGADTRYTRVENAVSPVELAFDPQRNSWRESVWVGAPDHAFGHLDLDYRTGGERVVELARGARLEVLVDGKLPRSRGRSPDPSWASQNEPRLRLRRRPRSIEERVREAMEHRAQATEAEAKKWPTEAQLREQFAQNPLRGDLVLEEEARVDAPIAIEGLPPGDYVVAVELGHHFQDPLILGTTTATLEVGKTAHATLHVEPPEERAAVPLAGSLLLNPAWGGSSLKLMFEPLDAAGKTSDMSKVIRVSDMDADETTPNLYRWRAGLVASGRYEVKVFAPDLPNMQIPVCWVVDTGPDGNKEAELVMPAPVDVTVRVQEEGTGTSIEDAQLWWSQGSGEGGFGLAGGTASWDAAAGSYGFRAAPGRVTLRSSSRFYTVVGDAELDVQAPHTELVVQVRRACGVIVSLRHRDKVVPWDSATRFDLRLETADGALVNRLAGQVSEHAWYLTAGKPGRYRVMVPDQTGFRAVPPIEVELEAGRYTDCIVPLESR